MNSLATSYSIVMRLSLRLAWQVAGILAVIAVMLYFIAGSLIERRQTLEHSKKVIAVAKMLEEAARNVPPSSAVSYRGDATDSVYRTIVQTAERRPNSRLVLTLPDGAVYYQDPVQPPFILSSIVRDFPYEVDLRPFAGPVLQAKLTVDIAADQELLRDFGLMLLVMPLVAGVLVWLATRWRVRRELTPLHQLAEQTRQLSASKLGELTLPEVPTELAPWIEQFNALMHRLHSAMQQLESFNADVAHELRTPLAVLRGHTEVALSRERGVKELREVMASSLEDLQQLSTMVDDMLFVSRADHGAKARLGDAVDLYALAKQVIEFHQVSADEANVSIVLSGQATARVDATLWQRAVSNLVDNATRYAHPGSQVKVTIESLPNGGSRLAVQNTGEPIDAVVLERMFDRFYRADDARQDSQRHHGLGLAIVAAITRMHGGKTFAHCNDGLTTIGFSVSPSDL